MSSLVDHARRELGLIGEEPDVIDWYIRVIECFNEFGHSGCSVEITLSVLERLLRFQPLAQLTYGPEEWVRHEGYGIDGGDLWQNIRDSRIFSYDGGKTHYNVEEVSSEDSD